MSNSNTLHIWILERDSGNVTKGLKFFLKKKMQMYQTALIDVRNNGTEMDSIKLIIISLNTITKKDLKAFQ